jgi:predicted nucleotidyltransferase
VPLKKYFYVLRPLLSVRWLERYGTAAPIEFSRLLHLIEGEPELLTDIAMLLEKKSASVELGLCKPVVSINAFIVSELERLEAMVPIHGQKPKPLGQLNALFHATLGELPSNTDCQLKAG